MNVIDLDNYRKQSRKKYLSKCNARLDHFLESFVRSYVSTDFRQIAEDYQAYRRQNSEQAWDYIDFRELLREALAEAFGSLLARELKRQPWYDQRFLGLEEVLDRFLSTYILSYGRTGASP